MNDYSALRVDTNFSIKVKEIPKHRTTQATKPSESPSHNSGPTPCPLPQSDDEEALLSERHLSIDDNSDNESPSPTKLTCSLLQPLPILAKKAVGSTDDDLIISAHLAEYFKSTRDPPSPKDQQLLHTQQITTGEE
jgi:hypothetical protein